MKYTWLVCLIYWYYERKVSSSWKSAESLDTSDPVERLLARGTFFYITFTIFLRSETDRFCRHESAALTHAPEWY